MPGQKMALFAQTLKKNFMSPSIARDGLILLKRVNEMRSFIVEILPKSDVLKPSVKNKQKSYGGFL